jgi:hypothetical protein
MRLFLLLIALSSTAYIGCDEPMQSNFHDLGIAPFKHIGDACKPDVPPTSECGYPPRYYCSTFGVCASACNTNADCSGGSVCMGSGDMSAGECRLPAGPADGGSD